MSCWWLSLSTDARIDVVNEDNYFLNIVQIKIVIWFTGYDYDYSYCFYTKLKIIIVLSIVYITFYYFRLDGDDDDGLYQVINLV